MGFQISQSIKIYNIVAPNSKKRSFNVVFMTPVDKKVHLCSVNVTDRLHLGKPCSNRLA